MHSLITTAAAPAEPTTTTENGTDRILFPFTHRNAEASLDLYFHRKFKLGKEFKTKCIL